MAWQDRQKGRAAGEREAEEKKREGGARKRERKNDRQREMESQYKNATSKIQSLNIQCS